jgi:hypothetical protein
MSPALVRFVEGTVLQGRDFFLSILDLEVIITKVER